MNPIEIPYHLFIPAILSIAAFSLILINRKRFFETQVKKDLWISISVFLIAYFLIVSISTVYDIYYQWDLNRYDLDGDGFFGGVEITDEQEAAMKHLTSDTGRNLSVITGLIYSTILAVATYFIQKVRSNII